MWSPGRRREAPAADALRPLGPGAAGSEVDLLRSAAAGDLRAVRDLIDRTGPVVYGFVLARVGGDEAAAEDVVQDTYVEATRGAGGYRGDAALTTWLCAIARRRLARHYETERRTEAARRGLALVVGTGPTADGTEAAVDVERRDEVVRALGRLTPLHRQVLVLKYLDDRPVAEVATEIGRTTVQVQSLLQRARDALRRELADG